MLRLKPAQRRMLAEKLSDAGNVVLGGLGVGQALSDKPFSPALAVIGTAVWAGFIVLAVRLAAQEDAS